VSVKFTHVPDTEGPEDNDHGEERDVENEDSVLGFLLPGMVLSCHELALSTVVVSKDITNEKDGSLTDNSGVDGIDNDVGRLGSVS